MTLIQNVYASAPVDQVFIPTIDIHSNAFSQNIRLAWGFDDIEVTLAGNEKATFIGSGIDVSLPPRNTRGTQDLQFAVENISGEAAKAVDAALSAEAEVNLTFRVYLASDLSAPAEKPLNMLVVGASFGDTMAQFSCSFRDILNRQWLRNFYDSGNFPGLRFQ